ncbi:hypothetical protein ColTof4_01429 [Colletotrichum tofieldiae]|nr:hypothetical protein ColTof3_08686 [Colletotrichum tofieldiae]GKT69006.1 hypothetical protein ColTof4_01429 [Colletotrichum tofieldiae]
MWEVMRLRKQEVRTKEEESPERDQTGGHICWIKKEDEADDKFDVLHCLHDKDKRQEDTVDR